MKLSFRALLKPMFGIAAANAAGQAVFIALSLVITRLTSPADMGFFGYFLTLIACGSLIATLGLESGIVSARTQRAALLLVGGIFWTSVISSIVVTCAYALLEHAGIITTHLDAAMLVLAACTIVFASLFSGLQYLYVRQANYRALGKAGFSSNALRGVGQISLTLTPLSGAHGLIGGETAARLIALFIIAPRHILLLALRLPFLFTARLVRDIRANIGQALQFFFANIFETFLFIIPILLFGQLYGVEIAGFVALVIRIFSAPMQIVSRAMADVYHGYIQKHAGDVGHIRTYTFRLWAGVMGLGTLIPIVLYAVGPAGFELIFGPKWGYANAVALAMSPLLAAQFLVPVATRLSLVLRLNHIRIGYIGVCLVTALWFYGFGAATLPAALHGIFAYAGLYYLYSLVYVSALGIRLVLPAKQPEGR